MNILFLTTILPSQRKTGGEIASQSFIDVLEKDGHQVVVVGYQRRGDIAVTKINEISTGKRYIETHKSSYYPLLWMALSVITQLPFSGAKYYSNHYVKTVKKLLNNSKYDFVIIDHAQIGWIANIVRKSISKIIFIAHNIEHEIYLALDSTHNWLSKEIYKREARLIKSTEDNLATIAKQVWTFTLHDSQYFQKLNCNTQVFDLPSSLTLNSKRFLHQTSFDSFDIGIIGSWTWNANSLGLKWFFQAVYPHLPKSLSIHVAGKGAEWLAQQYSNVKYCGFVPDVQTFLAQAKVIAIPSITGGGIQIKTLDAIASGSPIVATPIALRGITEYPSYIKVAEKPDEFAHTLVDLLSFETFQKCHALQSGAFDHRIELFQERLYWSQTRQQRFFQKVADAINV
jgi:glycosyltransferase involved in cell wall biosynthesis